MGMGILNDIPKVDDQNSASKSYFKSLNYMNYDEGESMLGKKIDFVLGFFSEYDQSKVLVMLQYNVPDNLLPYKTEIKKLKEPQKNNSYI